MKWIDVVKAAVLAVIDAWKNRKAPKPGTEPKPPAPPVEPGQ